MRNRRNQWMAALLLIGTLVALPVFGQSQLERKAQELYAKKDYKGCLTLLEAEVKKQDVSPILLRIAMNANILTGNPVTASQQATLLLKKVGTKNNEIVYEAAQIAELAGDDKLAVSRYLIYINAMMKSTNPKHKARLAKAASYVGRRGVHVEQLILRTKLEGKELVASAMGWAMQHFLSRGDMQAVFDLSIFVFSKDGYIDNSKVVSECLKAIWDARSKLQPKDAKRFIEILTNSAFVPSLAIDRGMLHQMIYDMEVKSSMSGMERYQVAMRMAKNWLYIPAHQDLFMSVIERQFKECKTAEAQTIFAKEMVTLLPLFTNPDSKIDTSVHRAFFWFIKGQPDVFIPLITPEQLADFLACYIKKAEASRYGTEDGRAEFDQVVGGKYYNTLRQKGLIYRFAAAFGNRAPAYVVDFLARESITTANKKGGLIDQYLGAPNSPGYTVREAAIPAALAYASAADMGRQKQFLNSLKNYMLHNDYNPDHVANLIRIAKVPKAAAFRLLSTVVAQQGNSKKMEIILDSLIKKGYPQDSDLAALKTKKSAGSNAAQAAAARCFALGGDKAADLHAACLAFTKASTAKLVPRPQHATTLDEILALSVFNHHRRFVWNNNAQAKELILAWGSKLSTSCKTASELIARAWSLEDGKARVGGCFYKLISHLVPLAVKVGDGWIEGVDHIINRPGAFMPVADVALFKDGDFGNFPADQVCWHIMNSMRSGCWSAAFGFKQFEMYLEKSEKNISIHYAIVHQFLMDRNFKYKDQVPVSFYIALLKQIIRQGERQGYPMFGNEATVLWCVPADKKQEVLSAYMIMTRKRAGKELIATVSTVFSDALRHSYSLTQRLEYLERTLVPVLKEPTAKNLNYAVIGNIVLDNVHWIATANHKDITPELKMRAVEILKLMAAAYASGNLGYGSDTAGGLVATVIHQYALDEIVKSGSPLNINRMAVAMALAHQIDGNEHRARDIMTRTSTRLEAAGYPQIRYVYLSIPTEGDRAINSNLKATFNRQIASVSRDIPGIVTVDKSDAAYELFLAQQMKNEGAALQAWSYVRGKMDVLASRWTEFDFEFIVWCVEQARKSGLYKEGMDLAQTIWMSEGKLAPVEAAKIGLCKGDIYRDWKSYPAAKIEYEGLVNNKRYSGTEAGRLAKFRLIELLILTQDFTTARTMLERLQMSKRLDDQAEAYYLQARIDFEQMDDAAALENLDEVFKRISTHPEARLLEGRIRLRNNDLSNLQLQIGQSVLATIAIPGKTIKLEIHDTNLSIIRGGKSLPVLVTTSKGGDSEIVQLNPDPQNPNKFSAELITMLGKPVHNNLILELTGDDTITYCVEPKFAAEHGNTDIPANHLEIRYPARLYVSSKPILSEQEQEDAALARSYELTSGSGASRDISRIVRPGSKFYVRVVDLDQGLDPNKPDTIFVDILCSSGDELKNYPLTETGPCTGVFEAVIKTGIPFPSITVSDAMEGVDYTAVINSTKTGSWKSLPDSKRPKWLEIDTMTSCDIKTATIDVPDPNAIKSLRVVASIDKTSDEIAVYPASDRAVKGGLRVVTYNRHDSTPNLNMIRQSFVGKTDQGSLLSSTNFSRDMIQSLRGRNQWIIGKISGAFYVPENMELTLKFIQKEVNNQWAHLLIDDRVVISGAMNAAGLATKRTVTLTKGVHVLTIYFSEYQKESQIQLGMLQADGSYSPLPAQWFDAEKNPALVEYLQPKGTIEKTETGFRLTMHDKFQADGRSFRYRKLKWIIENYDGTQVEITKATIVDRAGKVVVPVTQDLSSGKTNDVLEIAAADTITVKYLDKIRIDESKATLSEKLSSAFCNGSIELGFEEVTVDEEGRSSTRFVPAARIANGDDVIVHVSDPDEDLSEQRETVRIEIRTTSGERMELELMEKGNNPATRGHFVEVFRVGDKTDPARRTLKVVPGDTITASYLDKENNNPGVPIQRTASVICEGRTDVDLIVFDTTLTKIEDRSQAAEARKQMLRARLGSRAGDIRLFKDQIVARPFSTVNPDEVLVVNSKVPLMFLVRDPGSAKHANSTIYVEILTDTEIAAAREEQREQMPLRIEMNLMSLNTLVARKGYPTKFEGALSRYNALGEGYFSGVVRLQLGSANDEINDMVSSSETFNLLSNSSGGSSLSGDTFKIPTVIVSGSDKVYISYKDSAGKELCKRTVQLRSDGEMELYDKTYQMLQTSIHLGQHFYVQVHDPDRDRTPERDTIEIEVVSKLTKDKITVKLSETLGHSGIFTGSIKVDLKRKPVEGQPDTPRPSANTIWSNFGDTITFSYTDDVPLHSDKPVTITKSGEVVIGSDGELAAFTKKFKDPDMAVKTNFLMAEALFEMAKSHKALKGPDGKPDPEKQKLAKSEIARGKRVLEEALRDYPNTSLKAQGEFLLANLSQQLEDYRTAIAQFSTVISRYPDTEYAPKSYYQKAVCFEKMAALEKSEDLKRQIGDMACEEYVRLTYLYPNSALATDAKLRLGNYYYMTKRYRLAASVLEKFGTAHPEHRLAGRALLLAGYASIRFEEQKVEYAKMEKSTYKPDYTQAIRIFLLIDEKHKDNAAIRAEGMYYAGDCLFKIGTHESQVKSYQVLQRLIWDYPESKWAKAARGRMAANPIKNTR